MKYKLPNANDRAIVSAVEKAVDDLKKRGVGPFKKAGTLTDKTGEEHPSTFGDFCAMAIKDGHDIVVTKETYENVKFSIDGMKTDFPKACQDVKTFYEIIVKTLNLWNKMKED